MTGYRAVVAGRAASVSRCRPKIRTIDADPVLRGPTIDPGGDELIPLSVNEIGRRLLAATVLAPVHCLTHILNWSHWRRRRQHQARACHHRRWGHRPP